MKELYLYIIQRIHPGSIIAAIGLDLFWALFEGGATATGVGALSLPLWMGSIFVLSLTAVTLIQRFGARDEWSTALTKGATLGVLAAIPFSFTGAVGGVVLLALRSIYGGDSEIVLLGKLTYSWREIENILRQVALPSERGHKLDILINDVYKQGFLLTEQKDRLHELRKQRNTTAHKESIEELSALVKDVQEMEKTLRQKLLQNASN